MFEQNFVLPIYFIYYIVKGVIKLHCLHLLFMFNKLIKIL